MPDNDLYKLKSQLKLCEKVYKYLFILYAITCVPYVIASLILIILTVSKDEFTLFFNGVVFKLAIFATGIASIYKKDIKFTWLPTVIAILNTLLYGADSKYLQSFLWMFDDINALYIFLTVIASAILTYFHKKYLWLEQQEGFPYFNERFEEQKNKLAEYNRNNPYEERMKEIQSRSSGTMDEL